MVTRQLQYRSVSRETLSGLHQHPDIARNPSTWTSLVHQEAAEALPDRPRTPVIMPQPAARPLHSYVSRETSEPGSFYPRGC
jgi:hypothetical protein